MTTGAVTMRYNNIMKELDAFITLYRDNRGRSPESVTITGAQHDLICEYAAERKEDPCLSRGGCVLTTRGK